MANTETQRRVGRYEIEREVARGGTAVVYLARQTDLDRSVALKELAGLHASDPAFIERFLRESRVAGSLSHPNIVTVHEYFEHEGMAYIAMEYLDRGSLRSALPSLELPQVAGVLEGVLAGLAHAHSRGIVHRDLKPENVMVTSNGGVKIADFGVAKVLQDEANPLTLSGTTVGTPAYMAPEQALATDVGPAADLYAVGVLAYEMLAGEVPFHGSDVAMAIMLQHLNEPVPPLRVSRPHLDPVLCAWVERLLAKAPEDRPVSAADAWDELEEPVIAIAGPRWRRQSRLTDSPLPAASVVVPTVATQHVRRTRELPGRWRRGLLTGLVAAGLIALAVGGAALAVGLTRDDGAASASPPPTSESSPTMPTKVREGAVLRRVAVTSGDPVAARLLLTGPPLAAGSIRVRDGDITDGHAWFELIQPGISARTQGAASGDLGVRVRKAKNRLRIDLATAQNFESVRVRRLDGRTVLVTFTKPPAQVTPGSNTGTSSTDTTTTQDTTPEPPKDGPWPSG